MGKGPQYERDICRDLSLWFSEGECDDWFWRSSGSGARAKVRGRKGKTTSGHHGDITFADQRGVPLIQFTTLEIKRGYSKSTFSDILDESMGKNKKRPLYYTWIEQAEESRKHAGTPFWWLIVKRDRREPVIFFPEECSSTLLEMGVGATFPFDESKTNITMRIPGIGVVDGFQLKSFLEGTPPKLIRGWRDDFMKERTPKVVEPARE